MSEKVLLVHVDGALPNIALMRIAHHERERGSEVKLTRHWLAESSDYDRVYVSAIFEKSKPKVNLIQARWPDAIIGGTGINRTTLEQIGIETKVQDYSDYPEFLPSIGFSQRGCRLRCGFCVVPTKEGAVREENTIAQLWRGEEFPKQVLLLDNDFFGQENWAGRIDEMKAGNFKVSFTQGINVRSLTDEQAAAMSEVDYRDDSMKRRRIYTAWDNKKDEERLFRGLNLLTKYGIKPEHIMVYILVGYWPGETTEDRLYRQRKLRDFGCMPYPMPFLRSRELVGFQRWCIGGYDKRVPWKDWEEAEYRPEKLGQRPEFQTKKNRKLLESEDTIP